MGAQALERQQGLKEHTKTLICALNFLSHNLPLPPHVFDAVSSIYAGSTDDDDDDADADVPPDYNRQVHDQPLPDNSMVSNEGDWMTDLENALAKHWSSRISGPELAEARDNRVQSHIQHRLTELEGSLIRKSIYDTLEVFNK